MQNDDRLKELSSELRCLVCQNQSLADSNAGLALDLKHQIAIQMQEGKTNEQIKQYLVERYGEFVLYKPAFSADNAVLWFGPFILLIVMVVVVKRWWSAQKRQPILNAPTDATSTSGMSMDELYKQWKAKQSD